MGCADSLFGLLRAEAVARMEDGVCDVKRAVIEGFAGGVFADAGDLCDDAGRARAEF